VHRDGLLYKARPRIELFLSSALGLSFAHALIPRRKHRPSLPARSYPHANVHVAFLIARPGGPWPSHGSASRLVRLAP